jgi:hypothetical protein
MPNSSYSTNLASCCNGTLSRLYAEWRMKNDASDNPSLDWYAHYMSASPSARQLLS